MGITAKQLSEKLGISAAAVSMALNGKPGVSTATRKLVLDAATTLGYDFTKISYKKRATGSIYFLKYVKAGAVVSDTAFFMEVSDGINAYCKGAGYKLNIRYIYDDGESLSRQLEDVRYSDCLGIILLATEASAERLKIFTKLQLPIVVLDAYFEGINTDYVLINNAQGAYVATKHLIEHRRAQPGYLHSSYPIANFDERATGFYAAIKGSGRAVSKSIVHHLTPSMDGAFADMLDIINNKDELADCYFADNDLIAVGAMKALQACGYKIPDDIAVVGFDNIDFGRVVEPRLTTVHVPKKEMGETAAKRLIELIEGIGTTPMKIEIGVRLIQRISG